MPDFEKLKTAVSEMDEDTAMEIINEVAETQGDAGKAVAACQEGMEIVGRRFENGEYFVGDLIFAGELMGNAMETLRPLLAADSAEDLGKIILCTVAGDIHDIGKNIVKAMMGAAGFEVIDLGVDVAPTRSAKPPAPTRGPPIPRKESPSAAAGPLKNKPPRQQTISDEGLAV